MGIKKILLTIIEIIKSLLEQRLLTPVPGSGITLIPNGHKIQLVEENRLYAITSYGSTFWYFSVTGETSIAANIEWVCAFNETIIIKIPADKTVLYYTASSTSSNAYMRKLI